MTAGDWTHTTLVFQATYNQPLDDSLCTYGDFKNALTVTLICIGPDSIRRTFPCAIASNKASASYTPQSATDFPVNGTYQAQLALTYASGGPLHSNPFTIVVGPAY